MDQKLFCSKCGQDLVVPPDFRGDKIACLACKNPIEIPNLSKTVEREGGAPDSPLSGAGTIVPPVRQTPPFAVVSLVTGILGILTGWTCCCFPFPLLAIVFGHLALLQINRKPDVQEGRGLAVAGLIMGYFGLLVSIIIGLVFGLFRMVFDRLGIQP
jgi:hypothetical protein